MVQAQEFLRDGEKLGIPNDLIIVHEEDGVYSQKLCRDEAAVANLGVVAEVQVREHILETAFLDVLAEIHEIFPGEDNHGDTPHAVLHHLPHLLIGSGKNGPEIPLLNIEAEWEDQHEIPIFQHIQALDCPLEDLDALEFRYVGIIFHGEIGRYDNSFFRSSIDPFRFLYEPLPQFLEIVSHGLSDAVYGRHETLIVGI